MIVENLPGDQIDHLHDNDFSPGAGRDDPKVNEPLSHLKEVPTSVTVSLPQIGGREDSIHEIEVDIVHPWSGPKQNGDA